MADKIDTRWTASISAKLLLAVAPFRDRYGWLRNTDGIRLEPHPAGGVLVIATDGHAMAIAYDPDGRCTAPMTVDLPDDMLAACKAPDAPIMWDEGDCYRPSLPAWMIPSVAIMTGARAMVCHSHKKTRGVLYSCIAEVGNVRRDGDYRLLGDKFPDWRSVLPEQAEPLRPHVAFNPDLVAKFRAAAAIGGDVSGIDGVMMFICGEYGAPVVIRCRTFPNFYGVFMPMHEPAETTGLFPDWLQPATTEAPHA